MISLWENLLEGIKTKLSNQNFETWITPINFISYEDNRLTIEVPNKFFKIWIEDNYKSIIKETLYEQLGKEVYLNFIVKGVEARISQEPIYKPVDNSQSYQPKIIGNNLNPKYTFENFVVGASNQFAHAACEGAANFHSKYNPLFIYGGVGLGKTHLLNAIGNRIIEKSKTSVICYITAEMFMNELIDSIRYEKMTEFRDKYRNLDLLLIDDIQFIAKKERTQEEFFHTFNALYESHKQIAITSDQVPKDIPQLEERLRSRFEWGLIADIQPPEMETKVAILFKKAEREGIPLSKDVAFFLASHIKSNVRELEGSLIGLVALANLTKRAIDINLAKEVLKHIVKDIVFNVPVEEIQKVVAQFFNIKVSDLISNKKPKEIALPRQIAMYLSRIIANESYPVIGSKFGRKDHTTVMHAVKQIESRLHKDEELQNTIEMIKQKLITRSKANI